MGNQKSEFEQRFSNNYAFIEALQDPIHGFVKVYRKKFENYHYVMVIDRRLEEFNNRTFMTDCIKPRSLQKNISSTFSPKLLAKQKQDSLVEYDSMKLQKLKRTLELIKRYQDDLMVPFFSYQVVNGSKLQCTEPVIQLYVEFQNHRLFEYLEVLRSKQLPLKAKEIIYILKSVCQGIAQLEKMEIDVTSKEINVQSIFTSNQGEIKLHPIEILTRKEHQRQNIQKIENLKEQSTTNPHIEIKKIALGKSLRSSSSAGDKKSSDERYSTVGGMNHLKDKNILFSSNQSFTGNGSKLSNHKEILRKLLIDLSAFSLLKNSENKDLQALNMIINKSSSVVQIGTNLQKYGSPCIEGLLVERIYDFDENNKNNDGPAMNREGLSTSGLSNGQLSRISEMNKNDSNDGNQKQRGMVKTSGQKVGDQRNPSKNNLPSHDYGQSDGNEQSRRYVNPLQTKNTLNEYVEQKTSILRNNLGQDNFDLMQTKYQNIAKMSQYSQSGHLVSFNYRPQNQFAVQRNNNFINQSVVRNPQYFS